MATSYDGLFGFVTGSGSGLSYDTPGAFTTEPAAAAGATITSDMWDRGQSVPVVPKIEVVSYR